MSTYPPCPASSSTTSNFITRYQHLDILIIYPYQIECYHADGLILMGWVWANDPFALAT